MPKAVYVASPLGFSAVGRLYHREVLLPAVKEAGLRAFDPWAPKHARDSGLSSALKLPAGEERIAQLSHANHAAAELNFELISQADGLLAVVDGNDVDSGTAAEIGAASAMGKPIVGLRTDFRSMGDNDGSPINLQVEYFIRRTGGRLLSDPRTAARHLAKLIDRGAARR
ncbi:MAG: nucleoside 2-deoxyribosyltransferase [Frankiaceae bacterium]|nr:nucleoside 2-deoxyribosyltransferase [Frankiaceae bacterium]MBV9872094.1 nucleoside 2-deoxyribosyltransferase [Frankiaceae bacterium]